MGGKGDDCVDAKEWSATNTYEFIKILSHLVKDGKMQSSTFKQKDWESIDIELEKVVKEKYGVERLKSKFNRLRKQHREFSEVLAHTGTTYDAEKNIVNAAEEVWQMFFTKGKSYRQFRKKGLEHYTLLGEIFNNTTATGKLHHASTQKPPTSDEEREIEQDFLSQGTHVNLSNAGDTMGDSEIEAMARHDNTTEGLQRKSYSAPADRFYKKDSKKAKIAHMKKMNDAIIERWSMALESRTEVNKAKVEKYKQQTTSASATSDVCDPYSIGRCMNLLETVLDVDFTCYNKALEKFISAEWREIFVKMPDGRRKTWLKSLH